jgi:hypothetical protein
VYLTSEEERALKGEFGEAVEAAYRILVAVGELTEADRLIPIVSAHLSGVSYMTIGEVGLRFLQEFSRNARVQVPTTVNPCAIDLHRWASQAVDRRFAEKQLKIVEAYRRMGVKESFTCTPYEGRSLPAPGSHIAWAESSAAVYANSVLGLRTNRESALTALAAAITGKTPNSGLHLDENRRPGLVVRVRVPLEGSLHYGLLGHFAGKLTDKPIGFVGLRKPTRAEAKALAAGIGIVGASGMFLLQGAKGVERIDFDREELEGSLEALGGAEEGEAVVLGCPHLLLEEVAEVANRLKGRKLRAPVLLFTSREVYKAAEAEGYLATIRAAGGEIYTDACAEFNPMIAALGVEQVAMKSPKGAYYMRRVHKLPVALKDLRELLRWVVD